MNNRLQFRHHGVGSGYTADDGVFATRHDAIHYLKAHVKGANSIEESYSLYAEPTVLRYKNEEDETNPHLLLVIGSVTNDAEENGYYDTRQNKFCIIDIDKTEKDIKGIEENLAKAAKALAVSVQDTNTIDLTSEVTDEGTIISGDIKVPEKYCFDGKVYKENKLVTTEDGLFVYVNMEYDEEADKFSFVVNDEKTDISLDIDYVVGGEYTTKDESIHLTTKHGKDIKIDLKELIAEWDVEGEDTNTPIVLTREEVRHKSKTRLEEWQDVLHADVRIAEDLPNNILKKTEDGRRLFVDGVAHNIAYYKDGAKTTVKEALDDLNKMKLSSDDSNIIIRKTDGIYAFAKLEYVPSENKLVFTTTAGEDDHYGKKKTEITLNSFQLFNDIYYDRSNERLVINYLDAKGNTKQATVPLSDLVNEWGVNNEAHSVKLQKERDVRGEDKLSADVKISKAEDNILKDIDHTLYVKGTADNIKYYDDVNVKDALNDLVKKSEKFASDIEALSGDTSGRVDSVAATDSSIVVDNTDDVNPKLKVQLSKEVEDGKINQLKLNSDGLYVGVDLDYKFDEVGQKNVLIFKTTNGETKTFDLKTNSVIDDIRYNSDKEALEIWYTVNGEQKTSEVSLRDLIEEITVADSTTIALTKEKNDKAGADVITAKAIISTTHDDNILTDDGGLYVSGNAIGANKGAIDSLTERVENTEKEIETIKGNSEVEGSILNALKQAKEYTDAETARATAAEANVLAEAKKYTDDNNADLEGRVSANEAAIAVINATDGVEGSIANALRKSSGYTDSALESAKTYADGVVAVEAARATAAEEALGGKLTTAENYLYNVVSGNSEVEGSIANAIKVANAYADGKVDSVKLEKASEDDNLTYYLVVNTVNGGSVTASTLNIPKDQFLKDVTYDAGNKELVFVFVTKDGETTTKVKVDDLVDTYTNGDGIAMSDNVFSVKVAADSEKYLTVDSEGVKVVGVDAELAKKADKADTYTKAEVDVISGVVDTNVAKIAAAEDYLYKVVSGNSATEGSIKKALADANVYTDAALDSAKSYADDAVAVEAARATAAEEALGNRLTTAEKEIETINGNSEVEGSILNALKQGKEYTDVETARATAAEAVISGAVDTNATAIAKNAADIVTINAELAKKIEGVILEQASESDNLTYYLKVDGKTVSTLNIPKDQFLKGVTYDAGNKQLIFTFVTNEGEIVSNVPVGDLVDTYTAGPGLTLVDNKFSVAISDGSEGFLQVDESGIRTNGLTAALDAKTDVTAFTELKAAVEVINGTSEGSIKYAQYLSSGYTDEKVAAEAARATDVEEALKLRLDKIEGTEAIEGSIAAALTSAKTYANETLASGKTYTDEKLGTIKIEQSDVNDHTFKLWVDGVDKGTVVIPQDQYVKEIEYDNGTITFIWSQNEGEETKKKSINITDILVDAIVYKAGDGLTLDTTGDDGSVFYIDLDDDAETNKYLSVGKGGLKLSGVDAEISRVDGSIADEVSRATAAEAVISGAVDTNSAAISALDGRIAVNEAAIAVINGTDGVEGSIANALRKSSGYTDAALVSAKTYTDENIATVNTLIDGKVGKVEIKPSTGSDLVYNLWVDDMLVEGSTINIPKDQFLKDVTYVSDTKSLHFVFVTADGETTADVSVADLVDTYTAGNGLSLNGNEFSIDLDADAETVKYLSISNGGLKFQGVDAELATKADKADTYTKSEVESVVNAKVSTKADIDNVYTKAESNEKFFSQYDGNALSGDVETLKAVTTTNTPTIEIIKDSNSYKANVKINNGSNNALKIKDDNGLAVNLKMSYDKIKNTLTFNDGNSDTELLLDGASILTNAAYNQENKTIVLSFAVGDDKVISLMDLYNKLEADNDDKDPVNIVIERSATNEYKDKIKATLNISESPTNLILNNNGTLYASNQAQDHYVTISGVSETVQKAISDLETKTVVISHDMDLMGQELNTVKSGVATLNEKIAETNGRVATLQEQVTGFDGRIQLLETGMATVNETVEDFRSQLAELRRQLGNYTGGKTIIERIEAMEAELASLIDFGTFE